MEVFQKCWLETLFLLFTQIVETQAQEANLRQDYELDGEAIYNSIDTYHMGTVSSNMLVRWLQESCGYSVPEIDMTHVMNRYDQDGDY